MQQVSCYACTREHADGMHSAKGHGHVAALGLHVRGGCSAAALSCNASRATNFQPQQKASNNSCQEVLARCSLCAATDNSWPCKATNNNSAKPGHERSCLTPARPVTQACSSQLKCSSRLIGSARGRTGSARGQPVCGSSSPGPSYCAGTHLPFSGCTRGFWS